MHTKSPSPITEFSESFRNEIESRVLAAKKSGVQAYAAFDADGTLWDTDIGEIFFQYQIEKCRLPNIPPDPWKHYLDLKIVDRIAAYYWLAQINVGQKLSQVHAWAEEAIRASAPVPILKSNARLVEFLRSHDVDVFVVTASVKWAVEPAAALLGIDRAHVLGMETEVTSGIISNRPIPPATYREGKAEALLKATGGVAPILCAGNTIGDIALLSCSSGVRLAVRTQSSGDADNQLLEDEMILHKEAVKKSWLSHAFRA
jgi:phosphoserine phosphatase